MMVLGVKVLCAYHQITNGHITLGMDNKKVVTCSNHYHQDPMTSMKHVNLIQAIRCLLATLPIRYTIEHVRGHQDKIVHHELTHMERLNTLADSMANKHLCTLVSTKQLHGLCPCLDVIHGEGT